MLGRTCSRPGLRRTHRSKHLAEVQIDTGMVVDGEPRPCPSRRLAMPVSRDTMIWYDRRATVSARVDASPGRDRGGGAGTAVVPLLQSHFLGGARLGPVTAAVPNPGASGRSSNNQWERVVELLEYIRTWCFVDRGGASTLRRFRDGSYEPAWGSAPTIPTAKPQGRIMTLKMPSARGWSPGSFRSPLPV